MKTDPNAFSRAAAQVPSCAIDQQSLEHALTGSYALDRYDVLLDRVIVYLWPQAGGSEFTFRFRPRFAMQAETAPEPGPRRLRTNRAMRQTRCRAHQFQQSRSAIAGGRRISR